jgi:hypothetical protein
MDIRVTCNTGNASQIGNAIRLLGEAGIAKHFEPKSYGDSVAMIAIEILSPEGSSIENSARFSLQEGVLSFQLAFSIEEIKAMPPSDFQWVIATKLLSESPSALKTLEIPDFDQSRFFEDLRVFFEKIGWVANAQGIISFRSTSPTYIRDASTTKSRGRKVKYQEGDFLSVSFSNGYFLGLLVAGKFNKYYNLVMLAFYDRRKPNPDDFARGRIFGSRSGNLENFDYVLDHVMIEYNLVDAEPNIETVCQMPLISGLENSGYCYAEQVNWLQEYYLGEIQLRLEKTSIAEKFPNLGFMGKHLIPTQGIIRIE